MSTAPKNTASSTPADPGTAEAPDTKHPEPVRENDSSDATHLDEGLEQGEGTGEYVSREKMNAEQKREHRLAEETLDQDTEPKT